MNKNILKSSQSKPNSRKIARPKGTALKKHKQPLFVIHKHSARSLHYDLRLEDEGVLKSWAIPKGPSTDPHDKRLALMTEDHPLEYGAFEGVIEEGHYGAGSVIIWDRGTFKNLKSRPLNECIKEGIITIQLDGKKLHGSYALVRTHFTKNSWLFFKMKDKDADPDHDITQTMPTSVVSGKTVEEVGKKDRKAKKKAQR